MKWATNRQLKTQGSLCDLCSQLAFVGLLQVLGSLWFYDPILHNKHSPLQNERDVTNTSKMVSHYIKDSLPPMNSSVSRVAKNGGTFCLASIKRAFRSLRTDSSMHKPGRYLFNNSMDKINTKMGNGNQHIGLLTTGLVYEGSSNSCLAAATRSSNPMHCMYTQTHITVWVLSLLCNNDRNTQNVAEFLPSP